jgi:hypothetical protein
MCGCLLWAVSKKKLEIAHNFWLLFTKVKMMYNFHKKWFGLHFGRFFTSSSGHPVNDDSI